MSYPHAATLHLTDTTTSQQVGPNTDVRIPPPQPPNAGQRLAVSNGQRLEPTAVQGHQPQSTVALMRNKRGLASEFCLGCFVRNVVYSAVSRIWRGDQAKEMKARQDMLLFLM